MIKHLRKLMLTVAALLLAVGAYAHDVEVGGIFYNLDMERHTASVTYKGENIQDFDNEYSGDVVIPASVTVDGVTYAVTSIREQAFALCDALTSVVIPEGITSIGYAAFLRCSGLTSVTISEGVTSIESSAFALCDALTSIVIPRGITSISGAVFFGCSGLTSVTIPEGVTIIGGGAFRNCSGLASVIIPKRVTNIEDDAFINCSGLTTLYSYNPVPPTAGKNCFYDVPEDAILYVPEGSGDAYRNASEWGGFKDIRELAIRGVEVDGVWYNLDMDGHTASVTEGNYSGDVVIPASIELYGFTFAVNAIGEYAFSGCSGLTSVVIPEGVTSIESGAFRGCSSLASITIPKSVTDIGVCVFQECGKLTAINVMSGNPAYCFEDGVLYDKDKTALYACLTMKTGGFTIPEGITSIVDYAFLGCSNLTDITIPESISSIGGYVFYGCSGLSTLYSYNPVPPTVGENCFYDVPEDAILYVPEGSGDAYKNASEWGGFKDIRELAIRGVEVDGVWYNLDMDGHTASVTEGNYSGDVVIPASIELYGFTFAVNAIGDFAFHGSSELTSVSIPSSVTDVSTSAFSVCGVLTAINVSVDNAVYCSEDGVLYDKGIITLVACPAGKAGEFAVPSSVTSIGERAFFGCGGLTSVTLPSSVTEISALAFMNCSSLSTVYSYSIVPPTVGASCFTGLSDDATLYVLKESVEAYGNAEGWNQFKNIKPLVPTTINGVEAGKGGKDIYYDLGGRRLKVPVKGLNIVGGRKVMVK